MLVSFCARRLFHTHWSASNMKRDQRWCLFTTCISLPHPPFRCQIPHSTQRGEVILLSACFLALDNKGRSLSPSRTRHDERRSSPLTVFSRTRHEGRSLSPLVSSHTTRREVPLLACYYEKGKRAKDEGFRGCPPFFYIYITYFYLIYFFYQKPE